MRVPKKALAKYFLYLMAVAFGGLRMMHPVVHGIVKTRYEIIRMSCQSWSSVDVMYVQPPHVKVRMMPTTAIALGRLRLGLLVRRYHSPTSANLGPMRRQQLLTKRWGWGRVRSSEHTGSDGDEEHKNGAFGIAVANGGGNGREPFLRIAIPLVLDNLVKVQRAADDEGTEKRH